MNGASGWVRCLGVMLNGDTLDHVDEKGERMIDDTFLILLNCHHEPIRFFLPESPRNRSWVKVIDTSDPAAPGFPGLIAAGDPLELARQCLVLLREERPLPVSAY